MSLRILREFETRTAQLVVHTYNQYFGRRFRAALENCQEEQTKKLSELIEYCGNTRHADLVRGINSYQEFALKVPLSDYTNYQNIIEAEGSKTLCPDLSRLQPTSGSTSSVKWIPYGSKFSADLDKALSPWLSSMAEEHPGVRNGKHYWSLSWLPQRLREKGLSLHDAEIFPWWKRHLISKTMAFTQRIDLAPSSEAAWFATLVYLAAEKNLSMISVWSPTFLLNIIRDLQLYREEIVETLMKGRWKLFAPQLNGYIIHRCEKRAAEVKAFQKVSELWPQLCLVSCWTSASSAPYAMKLAELLGSVRIEGKGLWATEGCVTIPYRGKSVLAVQSHFYEFQDMSSGEVYPSWQLCKGQVVQPILSTRNGFLRYKLPDVMTVDDFCGTTPVLSFSHRINSIDFVGEKLNISRAQEVLAHLQAKGQSAITVLAVEGAADNPPFYAVLGASQDFEQEIELIFRQEFHFDLARQLSQLSPCQAIDLGNAEQRYLRLMQSRAIVLGNIKIEPLLKVSQKEYEEIFEDIDTTISRTRRPTDQQLVHSQSFI